MFTLFQALRTGENIWMILSDKRLAICADMVTGHGIVCDVGTDHAYLPVYLVQKGICRKVIAGDIGDGPLKFAENTVNKYKMTDKIELVKSNGLENISSDGVTDVIIAGMGAETICGIIANAEWLKKGVNLVLQPMTKAPFLRKWLYGNGYSIIREQGCRDKHFRYTVMQVVHTGEIRNIDDFESYTGKLDSLNDESCDYLSYQADKLKNLSVKLCKNNSTYEDGEKIKAIADKIFMMLER